MSTSRCGACCNLPTYALDHIDKLHAGAEPLTRPQGAAGGIPLGLPLSLLQMDEAPGSLTALSHPTVLNQQQEVPIIQLLSSNDNSAICCALYTATVPVFEPSFLFALFFIILVLTAGMHLCCCWYRLSMSMMHFTLKGERYALHGLPV